MVEGTRSGDGGSLVLLTESTIFGDKWLLFGTCVA
jgi:hypothetical protein